MTQHSDRGHGATVLWRPGDRAAEGPFGRFLAAVRPAEGRVLDYRAALAWSTAHPDQFWDELRCFFDVKGDWRGPVLAHDVMPGAVWYPDARVNFAENVLRHAAAADSDRAAIIDLDENGGRLEITWSELAFMVASAAESLRTLGVSEGDRVAAILPNGPEAIIAMLATASIGAIWCICSPDLSATATIARLGQLEPAVLFGSLGYIFNGHWLDRREHLDAVLAELTTVRHVVEVGPAPGRIPFDSLLLTKTTLRYDRVPFDHPLWVLFTSGTTGIPKGIVHGHGGMLFEGLKLFGLHFEMTAHDRYYVGANTSWMVWNTLLSNLLTGAAVITYSGSPTAGGVDRQFEIAARGGATMFGAGAAYLKLVQDAGLRPREEHDLFRLRVILTTGSTLADTTALWVYDAISATARLADSSGGTDICSAFIGGNPLEPVLLGRMQGALLGVALDVFDEDGRSVCDSVGELVITRPMPAMPVGFWNDVDGSRYESAYFARFPSVWTHGDWVTQDANGTCEVLGRSDATLNRDGIRLGSSEIYAAIQGIPGIRDSLVIGVDMPDGGYWMPLFVALDDGATLSHDVKAALVAAIRERASARHVPDEIIAVPGIPTTHTGKKLEVPIKRLFTGSQTIVVDRGALANPDSLDWFLDHAARFHREARRLIRPESASLAEGSRE